MGSVLVGLQLFLIRVVLMLDCLKVHEKAAHIVYTELVAFDLGFDT